MLALSSVYGSAERSDGQHSEQLQDEIRQMLAQREARRPGDRRQQRDDQRPSWPRQENFGEIHRQIGLIQNGPEAFNGYNLFAPKHYTMTYLYEPGQLRN